MGDAPLVMFLCKYGPSKVERRKSEGNKFSAGHLQNPTDFAQTRSGLKNRKELETIKIISLKKSKHKHKTLLD